MKKLLFKLMPSLAAMASVLLFATTLWAQFGHVPVAMFKVVGDTSVINKSVGRAYHYTGDNLYYVGAGTYLKQIATEGDSISLSTVSLDTLYGRSTDSIFVKDDLILLRDVLFSGTASNLEYWVDAGGDTVLVIDPNGSIAYPYPQIIMTDPTGADSIRFYHNGAKFIFWADDGTAQFDVESTFEADSIRSEDGNFVFSPTTGKTTILTGVINDSLRVEETARIKGTATFGATATPLQILTTGDIRSLSTAGHRLRMDGIGATFNTTKTLLLENQTAAAAGAQQMSPYLQFKGFGWKTDATASSDSVKAYIGLLPVQGTSAPTGILKFGFKIGSAAWTTAINFTSSGYLGIGITPTLPLHVYGDARINDAGGLSTLYLGSSSASIEGNAGILNLRGTPITISNHNTATEEARFSGGYFGIGTSTLGAILTVNSKSDTLFQTFGDKDGKLWSSADSAGLMVLPNGNVEIGNASTAASLAVKGTVTTGANGGTSGQINFIASDNDQANIAINTSDQLTFNAAGGGYAFDGAVESDNIRDLGNDGVLTIGSTGNMTLDVVGTGNSYVEIIQDNNAGYLAVGRTTGTESSMISVTDGGADNEPGFLQLYNDGGTPMYWWSASNNEFRGATSLPADDDAGGYVIMDLDNGTIGASGQALADGMIATTQSPGDNSTKIATTAYADAAGGDSTWLYAQIDDSLTFHQASLGHGMTTITGTDNYLKIKASDGSEGGAQIIGLTTGANDFGLHLGAATTQTPNVSPMRFEVGKITGTTWGPLVSDVTLYTFANGSADVLNISAFGKVGIYTSSTDKQLEINKSDGGEIRLTYDDSDGSATDHCDMKTDANGGFTLTTTDGDGASGDVTINPDGEINLVDPTYHSTTTNGDGNPQKNWNYTKIYCDSTVAGEVTLADVLPQGYTIETIIFKNTTANAITNLDIGFSDGGGEVVAAGNVTASDEGSFTILQKVDDFDAADTLYISAGDWNSANLIIYIRMHRMF